VPISTEEADIVRTHGWSEFEDLLEAQDPDLFDLNRPSVVCGEPG
jgi:succinate dehydrogenase flavin-adding protein (antitoxin of CptAB toxin-antitoxin module)